MSCECESSASAILTAYSCCLCLQCVLEFVVCISAYVQFHVHMEYPCTMLYVCVSCRVLWSTEWVRGVIKALLSWLCGGRCPGSGIVMDGMGCQSLGSLLASGTEVALLNTDLPRLSPNTTAHFKVNCLCGAVSSPPQGTRLLPFVWNLYRSLPTGVFWNVGVAGLCLASCRRIETQTHMQHMNTDTHTCRGKQNPTSNPPKKAANSLELLSR